MTHVPLHPATAPPAGLLWSFQEVLALLAQAGNVAATICGHAHDVRPSGRCWESCAAQHSRACISAIAGPEPQTARVSALALQPGPVGCTQAGLLVVCCGVGRVGVCAQNGYHCDPETGIHHIVLNAVVETMPDADCYGWLDLLDDRLRLRGVGRQSSYECPLRPVPQLRQ